MIANSIEIYIGGLQGSVVFYITLRVNLWGENHLATASSRGNLTTSDKFTTWLRHVYLRMKSQGSYAVTSPTGVASYDVMVAFDGVFLRPVVSQIKLLSDTKCTCLELCIFSSRCSRIYDNQCTWYNTYSFHLLKKILNF